MAHRGSMRLTQLEAELRRAGYRLAGFAATHRRYRHDTTGQCVGVVCVNRRGATVDVEQVDNVRADVRRNRGLARARAS